MEVIESTHTPTAAAPEKDIVEEDKAVPDSTRTSKAPLTFFGSLGNFLGLSPKPGNQAISESSGAASVGEKSSSHQQNLVLRSISDEGASVRALNLFSFALFHFSKIPTILFLSFVRG